MSLPSVKVLRKYTKGIFTNSRNKKLHEIKDNDEEVDKLVKILNAEASSTTESVKVSSTEPVQDSSTEPVQDSKYTFSKELIDKLADNSPNITGLLQPMLNSLVDDKTKAPKVSGIDFEPVHELNSLHVDITVKNIENYFSTFSFWNPLKIGATKALKLILGNAITIKVLVDLELDGDNLKVTLTDIVGVKDNDPVRALKIVQFIAWLATFIEFNVFRIPLSTINESLR